MIVSTSLNKIQQRTSWNDYKRFKIISVADDFRPRELDDVNGSPRELPLGTVDKSSGVSSLFDAIDEIGIKAGNRRTCRLLDVLGVTSSVSSVDSMDTSEENIIFMNFKTCIRFNWNFTYQNIHAWLHHQMKHFLFAYRYAILNEPYWHVLLVDWNLRMNDVELLDVNDWCS